VDRQTILSDAAPLEPGHRPGGQERAHQISAFSEQKASWQRRIYFTRKNKLRKLLQYVAGSLSQRQIQTHSQKNEGKGRTAEKAGRRWSFWMVTAIGLCFETHIRRFVHRCRTLSRLRRLFSLPSLHYSLLKCNALRVRIFTGLDLWCDLDFHCPQNFPALLLLDEYHRSQIVPLPGSIGAHARFAPDRRDGRRFGLEDFGWQYLTGLLWFTGYGTPP